MTLRKDVFEGNSSGGATSSKAGLRDVAIERHMHPSVGQFQAHNGNTEMVEAKYQGCAIKATYPQSIAPACNYGVFNTKVLEKSPKGSCAWSK